MTGSGGSILKWNRQSQLAQFLGYLTLHSTTVGLVRNLTTGNISPQYHLVFNDLFETIRTDFQDLSHSQNQIFSENEWQNVLKKCVEKFTIDDAEAPPLDSQWGQQTNDQDQVQQNNTQSFIERNPLDNSVNRIKNGVEKFTTDDTEAPPLDSKWGQQTNDHDQVQQNNTRRSAERNPLDDSVNRRNLYTTPLDSSTIESNNITNPPGVKLSFEIYPLLNQGKSTT